MRVSKTVSTWLEGDLPWEPRQALSAGEDGLDAIREIISGAHEFLVPGAWLLIEHGYDQGAGVRERLRRAGFAELLILNDLSGLERLSGGCASGYLATLKRRDSGPG